MEVRKGFKRTEIGIIPENWDVGLVGDLAIKVGSGITPTGGVKVYKNDGRPFMRSQNVGWGALLLDDIAFIDEQTHSSFSSTEIQLNDVLLNITGASIGRSAIADERIKGGNVNQHVCIIRVDANRLSPKYINLFLLSQMGQRQIDSFQAGGNRQGLNFGQIKSFSFPLPPVSEQQAIATALSDIDALLNSLDALIAKKRLIKQGAMQELLTGKKRLPGFSGKWEVKKLGELGKSLRGVSYKGDSDLSPFDTDKTTRLLRSNNVQNASVVFEGLQFVNSKRVSDHQIMRDGDILICMANGSKDLVGKAATFRSVDHHNYTFGTFMGCYRIHTSNVSVPFVSHTFQTNQYRNYIANLIAGSSINNLKPSDIEQIEIPFPDFSEQTAIAEILSDMDAEINALEQKREKTRLLKQGMMQELLTGRIRLV